MTSGFVYFIYNGMAYDKQSFSLLSYVTSFYMNRSR
jgi:hypothetical protein